MGEMKEIQPCAALGLCGEPGEPQKPGTKKFTLDDFFPKLGQSNQRCRKSGLWLLLSTKEGIITCRKEYTGSFQA